MSDNIEISPKVNIFVAYHKPFYLLKNNIFIPIHVGRATLKADNEENSLKLNWLSKYMIGDNTGDNISEQNTYYCELTAMYWIWKNVNTDYVGLVHYRRLFDFDGTNDFPFGGTEEKLLNIFKRYDVIMPQKIQLLEPSIYDQFINNHDKSAIDFVMSYIKEHYPEMSEETDNLLKDRSVWFCNMIVSKKSIFNKYSTWQFEILNAYDEYMKKENKQRPARIDGFLSERLYNIYFNYQIKSDNIKYIEYPTLMLAE